MSSKNHLFVDGGDESSEAIRFLEESGIEYKTYDAPTEDSRTPPYLLNEYGLDFVGLERIKYSVNECLRMLVQRRNKNE